MQTFNPSSWMTETDGSPCVQRQPGLQSELQDNHSGYTEKLCLMKLKKKERKKKTKKKEERRER